MAVESMRMSGSVSARSSRWSTLPGFRESWPGILAIMVIALFCELPGLPWPVTVHKLLLYIDHVLPPIQGRADLGRLTRDFAKKHQIKKFYDCQQRHIESD